MATARLTAYGDSAKGSGYEDAGTACATTTAGTALLASDDSAVFAYAEDGDEETRVYLAKVASVSAPSHFYQGGDGFVAGEKVYVSIQDVGGIFGDITNAGWYTVTLDGDIEDAVYISTMASANQITQPTACPLEDTGNVIHQNDPGNNEQTGVVAMAQFEADGTISRAPGITSKRQVFKDADFDSQNIDQLPFVFGTSGPGLLRGRNRAYKATTKAEAE